MKSSFYPRLKVPNVSGLGTHKSDFILSGNNKNVIFKLNLNLSRCAAPF